MKKIYLKPEIEELVIPNQQLLNGSRRINIVKNEETDEDEEVDDFDELLDTEEP